MNTLLIEYGLKLLSLIGVVWIVYFIFLDILYFFVKKQVIYIKETINTASPHAFDIDSEHWLGEYKYPKSGGYQYNLRLHSLELGLGDQSVPWSEASKKVFKGFDIETNKDFNFEKQISTLKGCYRFNRVVFYFVSILSCLVFVYFLYWVFVNYNSIYSELING